MSPAEYDSRHEPDEDPDGELDSLTDTLKDRATSGLFHVLEAHEHTIDLLSDGRDTSRLNPKGQDYEGRIIVYQLKDMANIVFGSLGTLFMGEMEDLGLRSEGIQMIHVSKMIHGRIRPKGGQDG